MRRSTRSRSTLHRVAGESLASALKGLGRDTGVDVDKLWEASDLVDEYIGDEPVAPLVPRIAVRAAEYDLPAGLVAALDVHLRAHAAGDRLLEVLEELAQVREEAGWPPLAAPIGQILASQALLHVLSARRYGTVVDEFRRLVQGGYGTPPGADRPDRRAARSRCSPTAVAARGRSADRRGRSRRGRGARVERGGARPARAVRRGGRGAAALDPRSATRADETLGGGVEPARGERIRELVRIVQESGVGEVEIEDEGMRVSVRRTDERPAGLGTGIALAREEEPGELPVVAAAPAGSIRVESPMVGIFYRSPEPGAPPFVEVGDVVAAGQTLCMLEAMKLFNELKADAAGRVRAIHVENAQPVEFGQLLFELEPIVGAAALL